MFNLVINKLSIVLSKPSFAKTTKNQNCSLPCCVSKIKLTLAKPWEVAGELPKPNKFVRLRVNDIHERIAQSNRCMANYWQSFSWQKQNILVSLRWSASRLQWKLVFLLLLGSLARAVCYCGLFASLEPATNCVFDPSKLEELGKLIHAVTDTMFTITSNRSLSCWLRS